MAISTHYPNTFERQILVSVGNRYVVFGRNHILPEALSFAPEDSDILPRVPDESEITEARVINSIKVAGMKVTVQPYQENGFRPDLVLTDEGENTYQIEIKVSDHDPKMRDINFMTETLKRISQDNNSTQFWFINIEHLKLAIYQYDRKSKIPLTIEELTPLDIWERTEDSIYRRSQVVRDVERWTCRVDDFYRDVISWFSHDPSVKFVQDRTVTMAEELMQKYFVPDRELPILDLLRDGTAFASFVPRGLWLIGAWGRIDVITTGTTHKIIGVRSKEDHQIQWKIVLHEGAVRFSELNRDNLLKMMGNP